MILWTLGSAVVTGAFFGYACKTGMFNQPVVLFKDDDHFHDVVNRYP